MTRTEIIELIQNKYDRTPDHLPPNSGWDDGTGEIADTICARITELAAELSTAKVRIGELEAKLEEWKRIYHVADERADDFEDKHAIVSAELVTADAELELRRRTDIADAEGRRFQRDREQELLSALSASIEQGKVLGNEVQVLREALVRITDECNDMITSAVEIARAALAQAN